MRVIIEQETSHETYFTYKGVKCVLKTGACYDWKEPDGKPLADPRFRGYHTRFYAAYKYRCDSQMDKPLALIGEDRLFCGESRDWDEALATHVAVLRDIKDGKLSFDLADVERSTATPGVSLEERMMEEHLSRFADQGEAADDQE